MIGASGRRRGGNSLTEHTGDASSPISHRISCLVAAVLVWSENNESLYNLRSWTEFHTLLITIKVDAFVDFLVHLNARSYHVKCRANTEILFKFQSFPIASIGA